MTGARDFKKPLKLLSLGYGANGRCEALGNLGSYRGPLFEPHHASLDVLTHRAFKGPKVIPWLLRLNARQIHLGRAYGQSGRALIGVFSSVYSENVIFGSPVCRREYPGTLSHRRLTEGAVGDVSHYDL